MQAVTNIFDQLRLSPPIPGPLHKRTADAADLGTTAEVLAAAKALYRLVEGRRGRQILDFEQLPKRDQNRYISEVFNAFERIELYAALNNQRTRKALGITVESSPRKQNRQRINTQ